MMNAVTKIFNHMVKPISTTFSGLQWSEWVLYVEDNDILEEIKEINYSLPPSYPLSNRRSLDSTSHFAITDIGGIGFQIPITINFKNSKKQIFEYTLDNTNEWDEIEYQKIFGGGEGVYRKLSEEEINFIIKTHEIWISSQNAQGAQANLTLVDLSGKDLEGFCLERAIMSNAYLNRTNFKRARMSGVDLKNAKLENADLTEAILTNADLRNANMTNAKLVKAIVNMSDLRMAVFTKSEMASSKLKQTNLEDANMEKALLQKVNMESADLRNVDFRGANLEGAILTNARVDGAKFLKKDRSLIEAILAPDQLSKCFFE